MKAPTPNSDFLSSPSASRREFLRMAAGASMLGLLGEESTLLAMESSVDPSLHPADQAMAALAVSARVSSLSFSPNSLRGAALQYASLYQSLNTKGVASTTTEAVLTGALDQLAKSKDGMPFDARAAQTVWQAVDEVRLNTAAASGNPDVSTFLIELTPGLATASQILATPSLKPAQQLLVGQLASHELMKLAATTQNHLSKSINACAPDFQKKLATLNNEATKITDKLGLWLETKSTDERKALLKSEILSKNTKLDQFFTAIESFRSLNATDAKTKITDLLQSQGEKALEDMFKGPRGTLDKLNQAFSGDKKVTSAKELYPSQAERDAASQNLQTAQAVINVAVFVLAQNGNTKAARDLQKAGNAAMTFAACATQIPYPAGVIIGAMAAIQCLTAKDSGPSETQLILHSLRSLQLFLERFAEFVENRFDQVVRLQRDTLDQIQQLRDEVKEAHRNLKSAIERIETLIIDDRKIRLATDLDQIDIEWKEIMRKGQSLTGQLRRQPEKVTEAELADWVIRVVRATVDEASKLQVVGPWNSSTLAKEIVARQAPGVLIGFLPSAANTLKLDVPITPGSLAHPGLLSRGAQLLAQFRIAARAHPNYADMREIQGFFNQPEPLCDTLNKAIRSCTSKEKLKLAVDNYRKKSFTFLSLWKRFIMDSVAEMTEWRTSLNGPYGSSTGTVRFRNAAYMQFDWPGPRILDAVLARLPTSMVALDITQSSALTTSLEDWETTLKLDPQSNSERIWYKQTPLPSEYVQFPRLVQYNRTNVHIKRHMTSNSFERFSLLSDPLAILQKLGVAIENPTPASATLGTVSIRQKIAGTTFIYPQPHLIEKTYALDLRRDKWTKTNQVEADYWTKVLMNIRHVTAELRFPVNGDAAAGTQTAGKIRWLLSESVASACSTQECLRILEALLHSYGRDCALQVIQKDLFASQFALPIAELSEFDASLRLVASFAAWRATDNFLKAHEILKDNGARELNPDGIRDLLIQYYKGWTRKDLLAAIPYLDAPHQKTIRITLQVLDENTPSSLKDASIPDEDNPAKSYLSNKPLNWRYFPGKVHLHSVVEAIIKSRIDARLALIAHMSDDTPPDQGIAMVDYAQACLAS